MPIHVLPPEVASQIAAGEVVERPASVVKELLENALDAGASVIEISVKGAGKRLIEVADDGSGIPAEELPLAVSRHATSKLNAAADLFRIATLGFRGEALASIGSVARLMITSRPAEAESGARLRVDAGHSQALQPVGAPRGTTVQVQDLFYNVPARLKFLKTDTTERRQIDELVTRYALSYPDVRFQLTQDDRPVLQTSGNGDRREVLAALYDVDTAHQMLSVVAEYEGISLSGFISPTNLTRSNRREIAFFVNGRWVQDSTLTAALVRAYHTMLMVGRFPMAALFIELPPESVDVNVHPAKAEVRFRDRDKVFSAVQRAVRRALLAHTPVPGVETPDSWAQWRWEQQATRQSADPAWDWTAQAREAATETTPSGSDSTNMPVKGVPLLRLIGQVAATYLIAEGPDGLYLVDQHAAHERVLFERFLLHKETRIPAQQLLEPVTVDLPPASARTLAEQLPALQRLGFEVEEFGSKSFLVRAIPALLSGMDPAAALHVLVEDFEEDEAPLQNEVEARIIARVCKRAAVKAGQVLSTEEQRTLLEDLEACDSPRTCPHGRPTMIHLSVDLLERQFGRKGAR